MIYQTATARVLRQALLTSTMLAGAVTAVHLGVLAASTSAWAGGGQGGGGAGGGVDNPAGTGAVGSDGNGGGGVPSGGAGGGAGIIGGFGGSDVNGGGSGGFGGAHGYFGSGLPSIVAAGVDGGAGSSSSGGGGGGGAGGYGAVVTGAAGGTLNVTATGGDGGAGGDGLIGVAGGGSGGIGLYFTSGALGADVTLGANVSGGAGGQGSSSGTTGIGGAGGIGLSGSGLTVSVLSGTTVSGGAGGVGGSSGAGGAGITGSDLTIIANGTIAGGLSGSGARANAITFTGGTNALELQANSTITGTVVGTGTDTLRLGGSTNTTFDVSAIGAGAQYQGFSTFTKTGTSTWTLTGTPSVATPWAINAGTLQAGATNVINTSSTVFVSGGTFDLNSFNQSIGHLSGNAGTFVTLGSATLTTGSDNSAGQYDGVISGTGGGLTKTGIGVLTLSGANTYTGGTTFAGGVLDVGSAGALGPIGTLTFAGGTLQYSGTNQTDYSSRFATTAGQQYSIDTNGQAVTYATALTSSGGSLTKLGAGTLTLSGANIYSGATLINGGTLQGGAVNSFSAASATTVGTGGTLDLGGVAQTINALALNGGTITNGTLTGAVTSTGGTINALAGTASLTLTGGTTTATGLNAYTGATTLDGGTLEVAGSVTQSAIIVGNGGTLSGIGKLGDPTIAAGGTLAPGNAANPFGTLTIVGPLGFAAGSFYNVSITSDGRNSRTNVVGATTIGGGTVRVTAGSGTYALSTRYTILNATAGVTGTFAGVTTNLAFLTPALSYDPTNVFLTVTTPNPIATTNPVTGQTVMVPDYRPVASTPNQFAVASGLTHAGIANGGTGPILTALNQLTGAQARATFDTISGEGIAASQNIAHRSAELFTSSIFDQTTFYGADSRTNSVTLTDAHPRLLASVPLHELADLPPPSHQPVMPVAPNRTWRAWGSGFGGVEDIHGSSTTGSASQDDTIYGGALGVDYQLMPNYLVGVALGCSDGTFSVPDRATSGSTTGGHVAFYDLATFGQFYGASSNSFSYYTNKTTRSVSGFGGLGGETERGNFNSDEFRTRLEFGRHFNAYGGTLTPFIAMELAELRANGFTESAQSGPGLLALNVGGQSSASAPSFVGARYQGLVPLGGIVLSPTLEAAYVHEFAPQRTQFGTLNDLPGSTFLVNGARPSTNAAKVKAGGELALTPSSILFANFDGEVSGTSQFYGGKGGFKFLW